MTTEPQMTLDQFLDELRANRGNWTWSLEYGCMIRGKRGLGLTTDLCCPITSLATRLQLHQYWKGAMQLGLAWCDAERIVLAADHAAMADPTLRRRLLEAVGLSS